jgi:3D (Asp-Asp-Asp) domain-containing protein/septal ring factor EnvC (AmiA/AmiB activator)
MSAFLAGATALAVTVARAAPEPTAEADRLAQRNVDLGETADAVLFELYALESKLGRASRRAEAIEAELASIERARRAAAQRLRIARRAQAIAQRRLAERLTALYVEGEPDPIEIILGASSLEEAITAVDSLSRFAEEDERIASQASETRNELREALDRLAARQQELRLAAAEARSARDALAAAIAEKRSYLASLEREQRLNEAEIERLEAEAAEAEARSAELEEDARAMAPSPGQTPASAPAEGPSGRAEGGRLLTVDAVAYSLPGYTASGLPVRKGVVAVDPTVIPLGTRLYVPGYGPAIAADVGTAIKGLIIDLWFPTYEQAAAWGRRTVTITVYD